MPVRGDRRRLAAVALIGTAAVLVVVVAVASGGGSAPPSPTAPAVGFTPPSTTAPAVGATSVPKQPVTGFGFSAVDDPSAHQLVVFGGIDSYSATWLWDGRRWTLAHPAASPPGRFGAGAAYDPLTGLVMLYGGRLGPGDVVDDTWAWDGSTWRELDAGAGNPPMGEGSTMAWDSALQQMVLISSSTWVWNGSRWLRRPHGDLPAGTVVAGVAFDPVDRMLLAVGCCAPVVSTYSWDGSTWRPVVTHENAPAIVGVAVDPLSNTLLLCSDPTRSVVGRQMWSWSGSDWMPVSGALPAVPEAEVTDIDTGRLLILAFVVQATQGAPQPLRVWSWAGATWDQLG